MNKGTVLIVIGIIVIVASLAAASYILTKSVNNLAKDLEGFTLPPGQSKNFTKELNASTEYYFIVSINGTVSNLTYRVLDPSGKVVLSGEITGTNITKEKTFKTSSEGKYTVVFSNGGKTDAVIGFAITSENLKNEIMSAAGALGVCVVGVIVVIAGIILAIKGKK